MWIVLLIAGVLISAWLAFLFGLAWYDRQTRGD